MLDIDCFKLLPLDVTPILSLYSQHVQSISLYLNNSKQPHYILTQAKKCHIYQQVV